MAKWHMRSETKPTGGKRHPVKKKKKYQRGSTFLETRIGAIQKKTVRMRGGVSKEKILSTTMVNATDPATGKAQQLKILSVDQNPANPHYVRRNIITKGAVVKTDAGLVKITSRPGQTGSLSGVLITEKKQRP